METQAKAQITIGFSVICIFLVIGKQGLELSACDKLRVLVVDHIWSSTIVGTIKNIFSWNTNDCKLDLLLESMKCFQLIFPGKTSLSTRWMIPRVFQFLGVL